MQNQLPQWTRNPHCSCLQHRSWVTHPGYQTEEWELAAMEPDIDAGYQLSPAVLEDIQSPGGQFGPGIFRR